MRRELCTTLFASTLALAASAAETDLPRNPFWPQDYEGKRYAISAEPRVKSKPAVETPQGATNAAAKATVAKKPTTPEERAAEAKRKADQAAREAEDKLWADALKSLDFGSSMRFSSAKAARATVAINGKAYGTGDLVSKTVGENRFTWIVESISPEGKLKLKRIKRRPIGKTQQK